MARHPRLINSSHCGQPSRQNGGEVIYNVALFALILRFGMNRRRRRSGLVEKLASMGLVCSVIVCDPLGAYTFDCSRPNVQQDFGLCVDVTRLSPQVDMSPEGRAWKNAVQIVQSHRDIKALYDCVDETIAGQRLVGGVQAFRVKGMAVTIALDSCGMVTSLARYLQSAQAAVFACTEGYALWEQHYGELPAQAFIYDKMRCARYFSQR
jgi:hypothetical protein